MRQIRLTIATLLLLASWAAPTIANATLIGSTVNVDWFFPSLGTLFCSSGSAVVGTGVEYAAGCSGFSPISIDITDFQVIVTNNVTAGFAGGSFNGFVMTILSGPSILSASFNSGALGFTSLAFDATSVSFNFAGVSAGTAGRMAIFDIGTRSVPEPGTLALLGLGLFGMGLTRLRKKV